MYYTFFFKFCQIARMPAKLGESEIILRDAIAKRFKEIRNKLGKTQEEMGFELGMDRQNYNKLETEKGATIYTIKKFCVAAEISLSTFFNHPSFK